MRLPFTLSALHPGFYMVMAMGSFTAGDTTTKLMAGEVPVGQIILIRGLIATIIITLICIQQGVITYVPHLFKRTILARSLSDMLGTIFFITLPQFYKVKADDKWWPLVRDTLAYNLLILICYDVYAYVISKIV